MRSTARKMAEEKCEFLLISELNKDQLSIAVDLACSLRADDIEKFLETYDSIPEGIGAEQIDQIKEMARQLAALPIKQFDMYRTKARVMVSGEHFNSPIVSSMNIKDNGTFGPANYISVNACKNEEKIKMKTIPTETEENKVIGVKSKKKSKKKKRNNAVVSEKPGISNVEISNKNSKDTSQNQDFLITKKFLDPADQSTSRIATMNRTLVADICSSDNQGMNSDETSNNEIWIKKSEDISNLDIHPKQECKLETMDNNYCSREIYDPYILQSVPPFGFPLSASKLIQSAVELLPSSSGATSCNFENIDCKQNKDKNHVQQENNASGNVRQSTSVEINGCIQINCNESHAKIDSIPGNQLTSKTFDPHWETESVDGDISNLSAVEDDGGWQSQVKRSNRKKKKELTGWNSRERTQADHKSKKNFQKDYKTSNPKKQNFKNSSDRNQSGTFKDILNMCAPNNATKDNSDNGLSSKNKYKEKSRKQEDANELFSYRDALLKTKPKPQDELQYNSDSGVDVNSVSSCDSAFHSCKAPWEFDVHEAVKFLRKGCDEVEVRHKQGEVHYYSQQ